MARGKNGRPTTYDEDIADEICTLIVSGMPVRKICEMDGMPPEGTVYRWLLKQDGFREQYMRAREFQAETHFEDIIEIADGDGDPADKRVRIDARKWTMSKVAAKKYGDKVQSEHSGPGGGAIAHELTVKFV